MNKKSTLNPLSKILKKSKPFLDMKHGFRKQLKPFLYSAPETRTKWIRFLTILLCYNINTQLNLCEFNNQYN